MPTFTEDESRIVVSVELPPGSTLDDTTATTDAMREAVKGIDGVKSRFWSSAAPRPLATATSAAPPSPSSSTGSTTGWNAS